MAVGVVKVRVAQTADMPCCQAEWFFDDEIVSITNPSIFAIEGREIVDWDFDPQAPDAPDKITITYDGPIEPNMNYSSPALPAVNPYIEFESGDHEIGESADSVIEDPFVYAFGYSDDGDMNNGPSQAKGLKFNTGSLANVTTVNIKTTDYDGKDVVDALPVVYSLQVERVSDFTCIAMYRVTGFSDPQFIPNQIEDTGYRQLSLVHLGGSGNLHDDDVVIVRLRRFI